MAPSRTTPPATNAAAAYLEGCGFRILGRNWRCPEGEIDIVAVQRSSALVVCKVSTRSGKRSGALPRALSQAKRNQLRRLAVQWLNAHGVQYDQIRLDIVGLLYDSTGGCSIEHLRRVG